MTQLITEAPVVDNSTPSFRVSPWLNLGRRIDLPIGAPDALQRAGLDWTVERRPIYTADLDVIHSHVATVRSDTGTVLGIVGREFEPVSNRELFEFLQTLGGVAPISLETAGALGSGQTVWLLARVADLDIRIGEDLSRGYMLLSTGHDASRALTIAPTMIRVACSNSLRMAEMRVPHLRSRQNVGTGFRIRHTRNVRKTMNQIANAYSATRAAHRSTRQVYELLARTPMSEAMIKAMFERTFRFDAPSEADRAKSIRQAREDKIRAILASPTSNVKGTAGSAFSLLQAVVEYVDHERSSRTRTGEQTAEKRFQSAQFGQGAHLKAVAFDAAMEMVEAGA
jgi:phage/plasmid-like protein (TIGR03299 family)